MRHAVREPGDLPKVLGYRYLRLSGSPHILICGKTGDSFTRKDEKPWQHHGYKWTQKPNGHFELQTCEREP